MSARKLLQNKSETIRGNCPALEAKSTEQLAVTALAPEQGQPMKRSKIYDPAKIGIQYTGKSDWNFDHVRRL